MRSPLDAMITGGPYRRNLQEYRPGGHARRMTQQGEQP